MKKFLLLVFACIVKFSVAQYCGGSGVDICSPGGLSAPGITDYTTFPCVQDSVPYNEVIQMYFPFSYLFGPYDIHIDSVAIDSITNLPCGLCWQCNSPSFTYPGGSQACIRISGTPNEQYGAYQLNVYGRVFAGFFTFPGTFDEIGYQFFLNVVGQNDDCSPIDIQHLHTACVGAPAPSPCNFNVLVSSGALSNTCQFDSTALTVVEPAGSGYQYQWTIFSDNFPIDYKTIGGAVAEVHSTDMDAYVIVSDTSSGCVKKAEIVVSPKAGPAYATSICYSTADSGSANGNERTLVFEKDNWFNTIAAYSIYRQDYTSQVLPLSYIGSISAADPGYITDTVAALIPDTLEAPRITYQLKYTSTCGDTFGDGALYTFAGGGLYSPSVLHADTFLGGYPDIWWNNSQPITYDQVTIFSRDPGGSWKLRWATSNLNDTFWIDVQPDTTLLQYMAAYSLTVDCDPDRSVAHTAFSNFASISISPAVVIHDTTTATGITGTGNTVDFNVLVYPNPANDKLYLQVSAIPNAGWHLKIFDMLGQTVLSQAGGALLTHRLDIAFLPPGVYSLALFNGTQQLAVKKFLKN